MEKNSNTRKQNQVFDFALRFSNKNYSLEEFKSDLFIDGFKHLLSEFGEKWIFQLEDTGENPHYQCFLKLKERKRLNTFIKEWREESVLLIGEADEDEEEEGITPDYCRDTFSLEENESESHSDEEDEENENDITIDFSTAEISVASNAGKKVLQTYCMKPDTRVAGPWADCNTYLGQDLPAKLLPWQEFVINDIKRQPDDRTINWIVDSNGCMGKSKFCKYVSYHNLGLKLTYGSAKDLLNLVSKNTNRQAYLFDLTRTKPVEFSGMDLYSAIEDIKNGHFLNTKYETDEILMNNPHIWVFANLCPCMSNLTGDRWNIWEFSSNDKTTCELIPYKKSCKILEVDINDD